MWQLRTSSIHAVTGLSTLQALLLSFCSDGQIPQFFAQILKMTYSLHLLRILLLIFFNKIICSELVNRLHCLVARPGCTVLFRLFYLLNLTLIIFYTF